MEFDQSSKDRPVGSTQNDRARWLRIAGTIVSGVENTATAGVVFR
jgi:hypothetical protein